MAHAGVVQASVATRRPAAEAALQSIVHLCRWACNPVQGCYPTKAAAEAQFHLTLGLLSEAAGGDGGTSGSNSGGGKSGGSGSSSGSSGASLCAAAVAAAGSVQLQRCAAGLADLLAASARQQSGPSVAPQLAAAARLLRCMCGCSDAGANSSGSGGSGSGGSGSSSSIPVTVACLHSRQGRRLLQTRIVTPAELLAAVVVWFDKASKGPFLAFLQLEVGAVLSLAKTSAGVANQASAPAAIHLVPGPPVMKPDRRRDTYSAACLYAAAGTASL